MKAPWLLTAGILAVGVAWGVREQIQLSRLREQHRLVVRAAEALGVSSDVADSAVAKQRAKRQREDRVRKTKEFAGTLVAFAKEMKEAEKSGKQGGEAMQRRIMDLIDGMLSLDSEELKILIAELKNHADLDDDMRKGMIGFSIMMLAQEHPEKALAVFTESADILEDHPMRDQVLSSALTQWAKDQPLAAVEWMKKNAAKFPDLVDDDAKRAVIAGAAKKDFGLAFQIASDLKVEATDDSLVQSLAMSADTPERQSELLSVLRKTAAGMTDRGKAGELVSTGVACVFSRVSETGFDKTMAWMDGARLNESETANLASSLNYRSTREETGKWLDWIRGQPDTKTGQESTRKLVREWTSNDYKAAGEWLAKAPAGPIKETAVMSYLETVAPYDPEVAAQWADTLSGDKRIDALKRIRSTLNSKDKAAADDFAKHHGLGNE